MRDSFPICFLIVFPFLGAFVSWLTGRFSKRLRNGVALSVTIMELLLFLFILADTGMTGGGMSFIWKRFAGLGISFRLDGFRLLYGCVASFLWFAAMLFSSDYFVHYRNRNRYYFFNLLTLGAVVGVFLSDDLYTTFLFFELMSFTSYVWVVHDEREESLRAGATYLAIAVIGGLVMLMGLFLLQNAAGTLRIGELYEACKHSADQRRIYASGICLLFGFGAKAGAFPLHIWLPKAHPAAPAPASALLSGILTKTGIIGILIVSTQIFRDNKGWGMLLLFLGLATMLAGAVLALFSVDLKRTLACSSVSQIGFILLGVGLQCLLGRENNMAVRGTLLHMVNHSLFKLVLFLAAGVVFLNLHRLNLNDIRGFGRKKPVLHFSFLMGALGIGGIPLWSGYISKTLLHEAILEWTAVVPAYAVVEWCFLFTGGLTIAYMLKLYIALFWEKNYSLARQREYDEMKRGYLGGKGKAALLAGAVMLPAMGVLPEWIMTPMAQMGEGFMSAGKAGEAIFYFTSENLKGAAISIAAGLLIYFGIVRLLLMKREKKGAGIYRDAWPQWLDLENSVYRPLLLKVIPFLAGVVCRVCDSLVDGIIIFLRRTVFRDRKIPHELAEGNAITHIVGITLDYMVSFKNRILRKTPSEKPGYEHRLAVFREAQIENNTLIGRSLSFGLFMFCLGLCLTLLYLLFL